MFDLQSDYLDKDEPWPGILSATYFMVLNMYHTILQSITGQMVFVCDMILNIPFVSDCINW